MTAHGPRGSAVSASKSGDLPEEIVTVGFPAVRALVFGEPADPVERRFPVSIAGGNAHGAQLAGAAEHVPRDAGETEDVVAADGPGGMGIALHQRARRVLGAPPPCRWCSAIVTSSISTFGVPPTSDPNAGPPIEPGSREVSVLGSRSPGIIRPLDGMIFSMAHGGPVRRGASVPNRTPAETHPVSPSNRRSPSTHVPCFSEQRNSRPATSLTR